MHRRGRAGIEIFALVSIYVEPLRFTRLWLCRRPSASDGLNVREHGQGIYVLPWMSLPV